MTGRRARGRLGAVAVLGVALAAGCVAPVPLPARDTVVSTVTQLDLARPRLLLRAADVATVQDRAAREPYRTLFARIDAKIATAPDPDPADQATCGASANINREEAKARAAKDLAFEYALNRAWDATTQQVVAPDAATRAAIGARARDYLLAMCVTSRIRVNPDRDINTSNEMIQMAVAYDTLVGAGFPISAADDAHVVANLVAWTSDFYADYQPFLNFLTNNHLAKGAASIGTVALALAGHPGVDTAQLDSWLDFAMHHVQRTVRYSLGTGDGTYGEGPFYWRYASQNVLPFARAYDTMSASGAWRTRGGERVANIWTAGWFTRIGRWELDLTRPDGTLAPIDDGNTDDAYYFGLLPATSRDAGAYAWRWANTAATSASQPYETEGNVDLAADQIVTYDDRVVPAPPPGRPSRVATDTGTLVLRSGWGSDAVVAFVQAEHGGARGFGKPPGGVGIPFAAVHDHADPGAFLLDAYGERLLLDPGYLNYTWSQHGVLKNPSAHNLVLVGPALDPESPGDPNTASEVPTAALDAFTHDPDAAVPTDGEAFVTDPVNDRNVAGATVTARYGRATYPTGILNALDFLELDSPDAATVQRRFLLVDHRYLVIADAVSAPSPRTFTWPWHGNGGGTDGVTDPIPALASMDRTVEAAAAIGPTPYVASGGAFTPDPIGATWTRALARVTTATAFVGATSAPQRTTSLGFHEAQHGQLASHTVLSTSVTGQDVRAASIVYPSPVGGAAPTVTQVTTMAGAAIVRLDDPARDHHVLVVVRAPGGGRRRFDRSVTGMPVSFTTDAALAVVDVHGDGRVSFTRFEGGTGRVEPGS